MRSKLSGTVLYVNSQRGLSLFAFHTFFDVKSKFDQMKPTKVVRAALELLSSIFNAQSLLLNSVTFIFLCLLRPRDFW
jgi:hypothetical protein